MQTRRQLNKNAHTSSNRMYTTQFECIWEKNVSVTGADQRHSSTCSDSTSATSRNYQVLNKQLNIDAHTHTHTLRRTPASLPLELPWLPPFHKSENPPWDQSNQATGDCMCMYTHVSANGGHPAACATNGDGGSLDLEITEDDRGPRVNSSFEFCWIRCFISRLQS